MNFGTWTSWCLHWLFGGLVYFLVLGRKLKKWFQDWYITARVSYHADLMAVLCGRDVALSPRGGDRGGNRKVCVRTVHEAWPSGPAK